MKFTDDELSTIVHALHNNARADRERIQALREGQKVNDLPAYRDLIEIFDAQATKQEKLAEKIEGE